MVLDHFLWFQLDKYFLKFYKTLESIREMSVILKNPRNDDNNFWNFAAEIGHMAATSKYTLVQFCGHDGYGDIRLAKLHLYCNKTGKVLAKLKTQSPILAEYSVSWNKIICFLEKIPFS